MYHMTVLSGVYPQSVNDSSSLESKVNVLCMHLWELLATPIYLNLNSITVLSL